MFRMAVIMDRDVQLEYSERSFLSSVHLSVSFRFCTYNESCDNIHFSVCFFFFFLSLYLYILVPILNMMLSAYTGVLFMPGARTFDRLCCVILL